MKTLVLGLGNTLLGDDGAGIYAINALRQQLPENETVELVDGGTLSFTLTELLYDADRLIVIDAAQLGAAPGVVKVFIDHDMDSFVRSGKCSSVHEVSLAELMDMARLLETLPAQRALVGVQPAVVDWADAPTQALQNAIPEICAATHQLLEAWQ